MSLAVYTKSKEQNSNRGNLLAGQEAASNVVVCTDLPARVLSHQVCREVPSGKTASEAMLQVEGKLFDAKSEQEAKSRGLCTAVHFCPSD